MPSLTGPPLERARYVIGRPAPEVWPGAAEGRRLVARLQADKVQRRRVSRRKQATDSLRMTFERRSISLSKREAEGFDAAVEELDLKPPVADRSRLTDQLIHPLLHNRAVFARVDIGSVGWPSALTVEQHAKPHGRALSRRSHHEVHIARVELVRDPSSRTVERARV